MKYVCYGSNLNHSQMGVRCPNSTFIGTGKIEGYRLKFKGYQENCSYLTIEKEDGFYVPVGIWDIADEDWESLDMYEGYPTLYDKENVEVTMPDGTKEEIVTYIMKDAGYIEIPPSIYYMNTCIQGYKDCGIYKEIWILNKALKNSVDNIYRFVAQKRQKDLD